MSIFEAVLIENFLRLHAKKIHVSVRGLIMHAKNPFWSLLVSIAICIYIRNFCVHTQKRVSTSLLEICVQDISV